LLGAAAGSLAGPAVGLLAGPAAGSLLGLLLGPPPVPVVDDEPQAASTNIRITTKYVRFMSSPRHPS